MMLERNGGIVSNDNNKQQHGATSGNPFRTLPYALAKAVTRYVGTFVAYSPQHLLTFAEAYPVKYLILDLVHDREGQDTSYRDVIHFLEREEVHAEVIFVGGVTLWRDFVRRVLQCKLVVCLTWQVVNVCKESELALFREFKTSQNALHYLQLEVNGLPEELPSLSIVLLDLACRDEALKYLDLYGSVFSATFPCISPFNQPWSCGVMYLRLRDCNLSADTLACIVKELKHRNVLKQLDLSVNSLGDEGVSQVASVLCKNTSLLRLVLVDVGMRSKGAIDLALALSKNSSLESIALFDNELGADGASALGNMLKLNTGLKAIAFKYCNFETEGCESIVDGVVSNNRLERVVLAYNSDETPQNYRERLVSYFRRNAKLWLLILNDEFITGKEQNIRPAKRSYILKLRRANFLRAHYRHDSYLDGMR